MKVGIISINMYSKGLNFACPVHSYAFQQFLFQNGVDNVILDYKPVYFDNFDMVHPYNTYVALLEKCKAQKPKTEQGKADRKKKLGRYKLYRNRWQDMYEERVVRYEKFQRFIEQNYVKTEECYDSDLLEVKDPGCDAYICATDVIWKNEPGWGFDRGFFLGSSSMENKWKFSYAASQGLYRAESEEEKRQFYRYLKDIDVISVREKNLKEYIEGTFDLKAENVVDPVLLHPAQFYDNIIVKPEEENYVLLYYVMEKGDDTVKAAADYARKYNKKIIEITDHPLKGGKLINYENVDNTFRFDIGVEEWLGYMKYADCIFTNSFHACCFSILFEKKFYVGFRRSDKVQMLLETFGLQDRQLPAEPDMRLMARIGRKIDPYLCRYAPGLADIGERIDYRPVRALLEQKRKESAEFILSAIRSREGQERSPRDYETYKRKRKYRILYNSRLKDMPFTWTYGEECGTMRHLGSGSYEFTPKGELTVNSGTSRFLKNGFCLEGYQFTGWNIRIRIDNRYFWYTKDGKLVDKSEYQYEIHGPLYLFGDESEIPYLPVNRIRTMVAEAVWKQG